MILKKVLPILLIATVHATLAINIPFIGTIRIKTYPPRTTKPTTESIHIKSQDITPSLQQVINISNINPGSLELSTAIGQVIVKHELESETNPPSVDSAEVPPECINYPAISPGQEIDETRSNCTKSVELEKIEDEEDEGEDPMKFLTSIPAIALPTKKIITFTKTVVSQHTSYETVYPSCLKMHNVQSVCDEAVETIQPTVVQPHASKVQQTKSMEFKKQDLDGYDVVEPQEAKRRKKRIAPETSKNLTTEAISSSEYDEDTLAPSEPTDTSSSLQYPTPRSEIFSKYTKLTDILSSAISVEPKFEFVTEYIFTTTTKTTIDYSTTATVIAYNCLPSSIKLQLCPPLHTIAIIPIPNLYQQKTAVQNWLQQTSVVAETSKPSSMVSEVVKPLVVPETLKPSSIVPEVVNPSAVRETGQKNGTIIDKLNKYLVMNANRLIYGHSGFEMVDFDADATVIEPSPAHRELTRSMEGDDTED